MPTPITHVAAGVFIASLCPKKFRGGAAVFVLLMAVAAVLPDIDVIPYKLGLRAPTMFGHRGFTHSVFFAVIMSFVFISAYVFTKREDGAMPRHGAAWLCVFFFAAIISHPVLDAFTDGGYGVGFLAPFTEARFRFPWHPIEASPIRLSHFLSGKGNSVLFSELKYVWLPIAAMTVVRYTYASFRYLLERRGEGGVRPWRWF